MRMIRKGEYDLVNISLIGCDPNTGKTYEQCQDEWDAERDRIVAAWDSLPWWNIWRNMTLRWEIAALYSKRGY
jgi:hypothetical protein